MIRIIIVFISVGLLSWILSPFFGTLLEFRGTIAHVLAQTQLVGWLGVTAIFSSLSLMLVLSIYRFFH